jgi:hypothetical protein
MGPVRAGAGEFDDGVCVGVDVPDEPHAAVVAKRATDEPNRTNFLIVFVMSENPSVLIPSSVMRAGAGP